MEYFFIIVGLLGGLGLFLYGMHLTSEALEKYSAKKIKDIFTYLTKTPALGALLGIVITVLLQGSTASTVLIVGFVSAGLMAFPNAIGVLMGSAIGTTFTVQLIAFNITDYALIFVALGSLVFIFSRKKRSRYIGQIILGFGLLFYGMVVMTTAMDPLKDNPMFINLMLKLVNKPFLLLLASTLFTAIVQSSAATLAIAMSLASGGVIPIVAAIPIMFGANIGTTGTALLSSLASSREAKRVAMANLIFKVIGVLVILPFSGLFASFVLASSNDISRQIANSHTFFNIIITLLLFPAINLFSLLIYKLIPEMEDEIEETGPVTKFIDDNVLDVPDIALWQVQNEITNMGRIVGEEMFIRLTNYFEHGDEKEFDDLIKKENQVDSLYIAISKFITALSERDLLEEQTQQQVKYLYVISDLEHIGDIALVLARNYQKIMYEGTVFPSEDIDDFNAMFTRIRYNYHRSLEAFSQDNFDLAVEVIKNQPEIVKMEKDLRFRHFLRMRENESKNIVTSSKYLDMISDLLRINYHSVSICQTVMGIV